MAHKYTAARTRDVFSGTFECRACGLEAPATVSAAGSGTAQGHGKESAAAAAHDAEMDASGVASRTLTFFPCPNCGKVDRSAGSYRLQVIIGAIVAGAITAGGLSLFFASQFRGRHQTDSDGGSGPAALVLGGVVALGVFLWFGRAWWRVKRRVVVHMADAKIIPPE
jgi:predicted RNA-binding Zn-ribbon protein involved in translation (DUF1610 family)